MFVKVNSNYNISLMVKDVNGERVTTDIPIAIIYDRDNNKYFNGLFWTDSKTELTVPHIVNGVYTIVFTPDVISTFEISIASEKYSISKKETIKTYTTDVMVYPWPVNTSYDIVYLIDDDVEGNTTSLYLYREYDQTYFNGETWQEDKCELSMALIEGGVCLYRFLPDIKSKYTIVISEKTGYFQTYILDVKEDVEATIPRTVSHKTIKSQDGTDTTVTAPSGAPITGAKITCYDMNDNKVVSSTQTNNLGEWSMLIRPGNYLFVFDKDGFISVSLQRKVL